MEHHHAVAYLKVVHPGAGGHYGTGSLVPEDARRSEQVGSNLFYVGVANAANGHPHEHFAGPDPGTRHLLQVHATLPAINGCLHLLRQVAVGMQMSHRFPIVPCGNHPSSGKLSAKRTKVGGFPPHPAACAQAARKAALGRRRRPGDDSGSSPAACPARRCLYRRCLKWPARQPRARRGVPRSCSGRGASYFGWFGCLPPAHSNQLHRQGKAHILLYDFHFLDGGKPAIPQEQNDLLHQPLRC